MPFSTNTPSGGGLFTNGYDSIYYKDGNNVYQYQISSILPSFTGNNPYGNYGGMIGAAKQSLQDKYGISFDSLKSVNPADFMQAETQAGSKFSQISDLSPYVQHAATPISYQTNNYNTDPSLAGISVNPNANFNNTGSTAGFTQQPTVGAATGVQAQPNNGGLQPVDTNLQLKPGETPEAYNARVASQYANLPAPGTTSSTGVTNTFDPTKVAGYNGTISSPSITKPSAPPYSSAPDNTNYAALFALSQQQQQAQNDISTLKGLNTQESGKAAFQTAQENAAGLPQLTTTQQDLQSRLFGLKQEAAAIPLQIQQDFTGRGVTKEGTAPIQTSQLRNNAIQSLTISAQIDATNGLIASANDKVKRAVAAQYGPIEAQIQAAKDNLDLLIKSPDYTQAEKKQAQDQLTYQNQLQATIAQQKTDHESILNIANSAAANGATASEIQAITAATTPAAALQLIGQYGLSTSKTGTWSDPYILGTNYVQKNSVTGEVRTAVNPPNSSTSTGVTGEQLKQQINMEIATPEFQALSPEDKALYIQSQGGTPYDFGY